MKAIHALAVVLSLGALGVLADYGVAKSHIQSSSFLSESSGPSPGGHDTALYAESSGPSPGGHDTAIYA